MKNSTLLSIMVIALMTCLSAQVACAQNDNGGGGGGGNGGGGGGGGGFNRRQQGGGGGQGFGGGNQGFGGGGGGQGFNRGGGGGQGFGNGGGGGGGGQGFGNGGGGQNFGNGGGGRRGGRRNFNDPNAGNFAPTTQPDDISIPTPQPMAGSYLLLTSRSIFFRGRFIPADAVVNGPAPTPREAFLVFDGTIISDTGIEGFLDNTDDGTITPIHIGDQIAQGKITKITLDDLDYVTAGRTMHLNVGQNLNGDQIYGPATQPVISDVDASDMIKKLRAKRMAELNGTMTGK